MDVIKMAAPCGASFAGLKPASKASSRAARAASKKRDTKCEIALRQRLWAAGLRYIVDVPDLPGRPDIVFTRARVAIFCDGDFWHGRNLNARLSGLSVGHNADYWTAKIRQNVDRDLQTSAALSRQGWLVIRLWETDIMKQPDLMARRVMETVMRRRANERKVTSKP